MTPVELLERVAAMASHEMVLFHPLAGGMAPDLAWRSLRLFEAKVYPETDIGKTR